MATCPICGIEVPVGQLLVAAPFAKQHRCRPETLRGIDANRSVEDRKPRDPTFSEKLEIAKLMTNDDEKEYED